jgi:branched-chain amino acid transport system substrate-binding protein
MQGLAGLGILRRMAVGVAAVAAALTTLMMGPAQAQEPIKIGFGMAMTGPLGANGKSALLGMKIWEEDTNARVACSAARVKLVYYDDQSNPSTVPGLYASCSTSTRST